MVMNPIEQTWKNTSMNQMQEIHLKNHLKKKNKKHMAKAKFSRRSNQVPLKQIWWHKVGPGSSYKWGYKL